MHDRSNTIGILFEIPGGTQEQYDAIMDKLELDDNPAEGAILHIAGPMENGWRVVDVWESRADFDRFFQSRLGAAMKAVNLPKAEPKFFPVHNLLGAEQPQMAR